MDGVTDDIFVLIHEFCDHPWLVKKSAVDNTTQHGRCHCGLSRVNRRLCDLFRYQLMHLPIVASNVPDIAASHSRVREVVFTTVGDNIDGNWSILLYLHDAPRPITHQLLGGRLMAVASPHLQM